MNKRKKKGYWTKELCIIEALKYNSRSKFKANSGGAYNFAKKNNWLDEACSHMKVVGNKFKRLVYVYEFIDKFVYIGLTFNIDERDKKHRRDKKSSVYKHIKKTGNLPILTHSGYMSVSEAVELEGSKIDFYKNKGYNVLNIAKHGAVGGGSLKWTLERCREEALECSSRIEFVKKNNSAYNSARNNGWLDEVCSHMDKPKVKPKGYWNKYRCEKEAKKHLSKKELYKKSPGAYIAMINNGWLYELCPHMKTKKPNGYWTKERCAVEALKYSSRSEFQKESGSAYRSASNKGWLNEICSQMKTVEI